MYNWVWGACVLFPLFLSRLYAVLADGGGGGRMMRRAYGFNSYRATSFVLPDRVALMGGSIYQRWNGAIDDLATQDWEDA